MWKEEACLGANTSLTYQAHEGDPIELKDGILEKNANLNKNSQDYNKNSIIVGNNQLKYQQIVDIQNTNVGENEISNETTQDSSIKEASEPSQIDQRIESVAEDSTPARNNDNTSSDASTLKNEKANILAATRAVKQSAMSRMRNSVKLTLFKGISKKVNPESTSDAENHQSETNTPSQKDKTEEICETDENQAETDFQIHSEMRTSVDMSDSKDKQSESTSLHKHRYNSLWNVIINERDPKPIGQSSPETNSSPERAQIINQTRIFEENYELMGDKLGEGCHGEVRKCIHKTTKKIYAVKMIRNGDTEIILSAITSFKIAKTLNHPAVIKPKELFINRETEKIYYVMEFCEYGSLQEYIENALNMSPRKRDKNRPRPPSIEFQDDETEETEQNKKSEKCLNCQNTTSECNTANHSSSPRKRKQKRVDKPFQLNEVVSQYVGDTEENKETENLKEAEQSVQLKTQIEKEEEGQREILNEQQLTQAAPACNEAETIKDQSPQGFMQSNENLCGVIDCEIAKKILKEILLAVSYLHSEGICHRDLKPDNILINKDLNKIKIIDFEISKQFKYFRPNHQVLKVCEMWTRTGTQDYMAPEMFESTGYSESVDIWAIGVIAYFLLTGRLPFDQEYISDKVEAIRNCSYNIEYLRNLDDVPKDFIRRMLRKDPGDRLSAVEALSHPWFLVNTRDKNQIATRFSKRKKSTKNNSSHSPSPKNSPEHRQQLGFLGNNSTILFTPSELPQQQTDNFNKSSCKINNNHSKFCDDNQTIHKNVAHNANDTSDYEQSPYSFSTKVNKDNKYISSMNLNNQEDGKMTDNPKKNICFFHEQDRNANNCSEFDNNLDGNETNIPLFCPIIDSSEEIDLELNHPMLLQESSSVDRRNKQLFAGDQPLTFQYQQSQQQVYSNNSINSQLSNSSQHPSHERNAKAAKKKEEFKKNLLDFKQQMTDGMTDILSAKFIHINQKQRQHPQASQLRLKLLQQKRDSNINSNPQPAQAQTQTQLLNLSKDLLPVPTSVSTMNITQVGQDNNSNAVTNIIQQSQGNNGLPLIPISPLAAQVSSTCNSIGSISSFQAPANNNNNNTYASNLLISDSSNQLGQHNSQLEVYNEDQQSQQQQQGQQLQNSQQQQLQIALSSQSSIYRSRSNTNDINNHSFDSDEKINDERRAKRLSEDFTSSCEVQTPIKKPQSTTPTSQQLSQTIGRVTKSSQFSNLRFAPKTKSSSIQSSTEEIQLSSSSSVSPSATGERGGGAVAGFQKQFQKIQQQCSLEVQLSGKHSSESNQKKLTIFNFCEGNMKQQPQQQGCVQEEAKEEVWGNQEICQFQCDGGDSATAEDDNANTKILQQHSYGFPSQFRDFSDEKEKD